MLRLSSGVRFASVVIAADRITAAVTDGELNVLAETGEPAEVRTDRRR
ncbi:hypothetical protein [Micromonospora sp. LOL_024]